MQDSFISDGDVWEGFLEDVMKQVLKKELKLHI